MYKALAALVRVRVQISSTISKERKKGGKQEGRDRKEEKQCPPQVTSKLVLHG